MWLVALLLAGGFGLAVFLVARPLVVMPRPVPREPAREDPGLAERLRAHVEALATRIGPRHLHRPESLAEAARYIEEDLRASGYEVTRQPFDCLGVEICNLEAVLPGGEETLVVGAHYDSVVGCPAADDNGSGVAATLEIARMLRRLKPRRTVRFLAFVNEEPPWFQTESMGSLVYARAARRRGDRIIGMISLETIGYFDDEPGSQAYPAPLSAFYPDTGDFIGFVGNLASRAFVRRCVELFRAHSPFPCEGAALPAMLPGIGWSDHWAFWQVGYPGLMVTDTAPYRYPHYHERTDTPDKLDFERMARVVEGVAKVIEVLATEPAGRGRDG